MIDENVTHEKFGYYSTELSPKSSKKIVAVCDECGKVRDTRKDSYRKLCGKCAQKGKRASEETKKKLSESHKGIKHSLESRKKMSEVQTGKTVSIETRKKLSEANKGKKASLETRKKMSEAQKGKKMSLESRKKISEGNKGKKRSLETRKRISDAKKNPSDETRKKISDAMKNPSVETRRKMSESAKNRSLESRIGVKLPEEARKKISVIAKERKYSDETREKMSTAHKGMVFSLEHKKKISEAQIGKDIPLMVRKKMSAAKQGIPYDEWKEFAANSPYCPKFNESCRESNREKYDRCCFLCGKPEAENMTVKGVCKKLSVHHIDRNKQQGCDNHNWALVPLCMEHHTMAHNDLWEARINYLLMILKTEE